MGPFSACAVILPSRQILSAAKDGRHDLRMSTSERKILTFVAYLGIVTVVVKIQAMIGTC